MNYQLLTQVNYERSARLLGSKTKSWPVGASRIGFEHESQTFVMTHELVRVMVNRMRKVAVMNYAQGYQTGNEDGYDEGYEEGQAVLAHRIYQNYG